MIRRNETVVNAGHMRVIRFGWQTMNSQIIEQLGRADILLPSLVAEGLAASDRIWVRMKLPPGTVEPLPHIVRPTLAGTLLAPTSFRHCAGGIDD
jgi:hypothetical protein